MSFMKRKMLLVVIVSIMYFPVSVFAGQIGIEPVATNLALPVSITHAGDGSGRLFISLQNGTVVIFDGDQVLTVPFLDIRQRVSCCGEQGLLSVAFHPNYITNGYFFVNYTNKEGDTVIERYRVSDNPNSADQDSAELILTIPQPFSNHNGGQLKFGPDGYLYIGMGDGGSGGDPENNAQNLGTLLGKMLRIDVDNAAPFAIPPNNPFVNNPKARDEIWAFGLRNPWRFSFDRITGDLFISDVGQNRWEEANFQMANSSGGENYGWRLMEGNHCFNPQTDCNNDGSLVIPIVEYDHSLGCSITGGYRYRGKKIQKLDGIYVYGDFCSGRIWGAKEDGNKKWKTSELLDTDFSISTFGEDEEGELYFAHYSKANGTIYRICPAFTISPPTGKYISTQDIDLALIVKVSGFAVVNSAATLDGNDVTHLLKNCFVKGTILSGGQTFRCPDSMTTMLDAGVHTLTVSITFNDTTTTTDTVTWEILKNTEP
ncbi:MAG: PQQ-dependent sugar dehydrogenase [Candidatus Brocadiaceae bacterium]|nr:PQQ-dependent sugar dehydrogenase [Candidatus Brocadiaceae bacterium]